MKVVRLKKRGTILYLEPGSTAPAKKGDRFRASMFRPSTRESDAAGNASGCTLGELPDGTRFFSCRRGRAYGSSDDGHIISYTDYRFDPDLHEVVEEPAW